VAEQGRIGRPEFQVVDVAIQGLVQFEYELRHEPSHGDLQDGLRHIA
jgi:hypothetical protein